jgi:hypothetical protein
MGLAYRVGLFVRGMRSSWPKRAENRASRSHHDRWPHGLAAGPGVAFGEAFAAAESAIRICHASLAVAKERPFYVKLMRPSLSVEHLSGYLVAE